MSNIIPFPVRENEYVQNYLRKMKEYNKNAQEFEMLLNTTHSLEIMLYRSNRGLVAMQKQLDEIKEIQKHHIKAELNNINNSIHKNADSAKSMLAELKEKIINACKVILQGLKDHGSSALNKTACFLKLQKRLETIANTAVKNNNYCDNAIKRIEQFSEDYHKIGLSLRNMGRIMIGKEPIDATLENGKLAAVVSASYKREKGIWVAIEKKAFIAARDLGDFHTRTQINKKGTKQVATNETLKKTDVFADVNTHKANISENKENLTVDIKKERTELR